MLSIEGSKVPCRIRRLTLIHRRCDKCVKMLLFEQARHYDFHATILPLKKNFALTCLMVYVEFKCALQRTDKWVDEWRPFPADRVEFKMLDVYNLHET